MVQAYISGTGFYVPPRVVTNDDLINTYGVATTHDWIVQRTGIEARRFAEPGVGTSDMALEASRAALGEAKLEAHDATGAQAEFKTMTQACGTCHKAHKKDK